MKKRIAIVSGILLALVVVVAWAVPAFAAGSSEKTQPPANKARILVRLLTVQDEARVDAFLARGVDSGRLTRERAAAIKNVWVNRHAQFAKGKVLPRLLGVRDGAKVDALLTKAVDEGRIKSGQANKIKALWLRMHAK